MKYSIKMLALMIALVQGTAVMGFDVAIKSNPNNPKNLGYATPDGPGLMHVTCPDKTSDLAPGAELDCKISDNNRQFTVDRYPHGFKSHPCTLVLTNNNEWDKVGGWGKDRCSTRWTYVIEKQGDKAIITFLYNSKG